MSESMRIGIKRITGFLFIIVPSLISANEEVLSPRTNSFHIELAGKGLFWANLGYERHFTKFLGTGLAVSYIWNSSTTYEYLPEGGKILRETHWTTPLYVTLNTTGKHRFQGIVGLSLLLDIGCWEDIQSNEKEGGSFKVSDLTPFLGIGYERIGRVLVFRVTGYLAIFGGDLVPVLPWLGCSWGIPFGKIL